MKSNISRPIRKLSVGPDYKSGAMHYIVGQPVLIGYSIHLIKYNIETNSAELWIEKENEVVLWKDFVGMPLSIEYNINF